MNCLFVYIAKVSIFFNPKHDLARFFDVIHHIGTISHCLLIKNFVKSLKWQFEKSTHHFNSQKTNRDRTLQGGPDCSVTQLLMSYQMSFL